MMAVVSEYSKRCQTPVAVRDRFEVALGVLDDQVFDQARRIFRRSVGEDVGREGGDAVFPAGDAGIDPLPVFVAELEHLQRDLDIHGGGIP